MTGPLEPLRAELADRYLIDREIGRGGMATVYLANDRKHDRPVALKVLRPELTSHGSERFLREIGIAARLSHPHIVPLIDSGAAAGQLYYVSPFIPGGSLRDRIAARRQLPVNEVVRIAQEIATGLDYAHRQGIVHRDVKPENILFADGHALLADFGIARALSTTDATPAPGFVTDRGLVVGTAEYMSPEQASGDPELGSSSDIYALACVLYELLAGTPPIRGENARATMARQVTESPTPLRALRPDAPRAMASAIARALSKEPGDRFSGAIEFVTALVAPEPDQGASHDSINECRIAVLPFVNASPEPANEYLSDGITDELIDALAHVDGLGVASRTSVFALKGRSLDVRAIGARLGVGVVLEGTVRMSGTRLRITAQLTSTDDGRLLWSERYDRELDDVFAIQDDIARTITDTLRATSFAALDRELALPGVSPAPRRYTSNVKAYGFYLKGRYAWNQRTVEGVTEAVEWFERAVQEDPGYALAYTGLSDAWALHVDYRSVPVAEGLDRAKSYAIQALELDDTLAEAHTSLAWCQFIYDWDWPAADRSFRRAIEIDPRYATARQWHAFLLASQGRLDAAIAEGHRALSLDTTSVSVRRSVGWLYYYSRHWADARHHMTRAIAMNPVTDENYRVLGLILVHQGSFAEAERVLRDAVEIPGAGSYTLATLGYALARAGKRDEASGVLADLERRALGEYISPVSFATLHIGLDNLDEAMTWAERAYDDRRGWLAYLRVNPLFDSMRDRPDFQALVRRMRL
jgi:serine/threonine-protein kinase